MDQQAAKKPDWEVEVEKLASQANTFTPTMKAYLITVIARKMSSELYHYEDRVQKLEGK